MSGLDDTGSVGPAGGELWRRLRAAGAVLGEEELVAIEAADLPDAPIDIVATQMAISKALVFRGNFGIDEIVSER